MSHFRVGFMAPKKVIDKKAVVRNRAKRRLREAARTVMPISARHGTCVGSVHAAWSLNLNVNNRFGGCWVTGYDYLFLAQPASLTVPFHELQEALRKVRAT